MTTLLPNAADPTPLLASSSGGCDGPEPNRSDEIAHYELHCFDDILNDIGLFVDEDMDFGSAAVVSSPVPMVTSESIAAVQIQSMPDPLSKPTLTAGPVSSTHPYNLSDLSPLQQMKEATESLAISAPPVAASPCPSVSDASGATPDMIPSQVTFQFAQPVLYTTTLAESSAHTPPSSPSLAPLAPAPSPRCVGAMNQAFYLSKSHPGDASCVSTDGSDHGDDQQQCQPATTTTIMTALASAASRKRKATSPSHADGDLSDEQLSERRERNREHARKSRARKKSLTQNLELTMQRLQEENEKLRSQIEIMFGSKQTEAMIRQRLDDPNEVLIASLKKPANKVMDAGSLKFLQGLRKNVPMRSNESFTTSG